MKASKLRINICCTRSTLYNFIHISNQAMNKDSIKKELTDKHNSFIDYINSLSDNDFIDNRNSTKWSAGEQLQHIYLSVRPVNLAMLIPKFILRFLFGKPHQNRTYEELVVTYQKSLLNGGKAGSQFIPKNVSIGKRKILIDDLARLINSLNEKIEGLSEQDLDKYILPHPLIGKISIREMLYFTIYHVQHHHQSVVENLK